MLEIIELQITGKDSEKVKACLKQLFKQVQKDKDIMIKVYSKLNLDNDFSIHLFDNTNTLEQHGSALGQHLVSVLKEFGLVNHSMWIEKTTQ